MASPYQPLPGFRDFAPREFLVRRYLFDTWRAVAGRYGFAEYEAPLLEEAELYLKKSGGEISKQLFRFQDQGDRDVVLRPELTASLARMVALTQRDYPKPLKWFEIGACFRYEKPQKGRFREFYQFNADLIGESGPAADAELVALAIDVMREFGFSEDDFRIRLSDRTSWQAFASAHDIAPASLGEFLGIIDHLERADREKTEAALKPFGVSLSQVEAFIADPSSYSPQLSEVLADLETRGLGQFVEVDLRIVRGLAYYTGVVFEIFDARKSLRAVAGGGRYDELLSVVSNGKVDLPATGFAMGDAVIAEFIQDIPKAQLRFTAWCQRQGTCDVYLVIDDEEKRPEALRIASTLRESGIATDFPLSPAKFPRQMKAAEATLARYAVIVGARFPEIRLKNLSSGTEESLPPNADLVSSLRTRLTGPEGPLLA